MKGEPGMYDDEGAVRLLHPLRADPPGPARLDVSRLMAEGGRRRRMRRWSTGAALAAVTAVAAGGGTLTVAALRTDPAPRPAPTRGAVPVSPTVTAAAVPPGPVGCTVALLPTGGIAKALVTGGDPSGRYLAGRIYPRSGGVRTIIWKDGAIEARPSRFGDDASFDDLNSAGVAVGSGWDGQGIHHAYVYRDGKVTKLRGGEAGAEAINDAGVIVGSVGEIYNGVPARWSSPDAAATKLPMPAGATGGAAGGIAEDGTIFGTLGKLGAEHTGYLWMPDGTGRAMPLPTVDGEKADFFWPESVVDGLVTGRAVFDQAKDGSRRFASMRYRIATGRYERLPIPMGPPAIVAANGWILGDVGDHLAIVAGSTVLDLPRYAKQREYVVSSFSADGRVAAGYSTDGMTDGEVRNLPLVWTCH
ncbi:hypothetical protein ACWKSP_02495 [Micromonosporaceae bacterium Da 78-11]